LNGEGSVEPLKLTDPGSTRGPGLTLLLTLILIGIVVIAAFSQWILPLVMDFDPNVTPTWALPLVR